jgi:hypothetical protein
MANNGIWGDGARYTQSSRSWVELMSETLPFARQSTIQLIKRYNIKRMESGDVASLCLIWTLDGGEP